MRFKQICNHPSQWLGDGAMGRGGQRQVRAAARDRRGDRRAAGEGARLHAVPRDDGAARRASSAASSAAPGLVLHGETPVDEARRSWCAGSRRTRRSPFFVLSLKAGGTGLNLTAASHVDPLRPLVEPGGREPGHRPGLPHRPEEERARPQVRLPRHGRGEDRRADRVQAAALARPPRGGAELLLTEMKDDELLKLVALDLRAASAAE